MNTARIHRFTTTLLATCVFLGINSTAHADDDHKLQPISPTIAASGEASQRMSTGAIIAKLERAGYSHITEVELDDGHYEVEARNKQGQRVELDVHAFTGKVLRTQRED